MIESILLFQRDDESAFWSDSLYCFYPQLDKDHARSLACKARADYISANLRSVYLDLADTIDQKTKLYAQHWEENKAQITQALSEAFGIDCSALFTQMHCNVSMNPVSPRFLEEQHFEVFYLNSERGAIGVAIHEIIHMVWFHVWNQIFGDSFSEYERPSLKWILSEMVVESIMKDPRLSSINPYFPRERGGCIYPYFFDMKAGDALILDTLDEMYQNQGIEEFMKNSYRYCLQHEEEIRRHIASAE